MKDKLLEKKIYIEVTETITKDIVEKFKKAKTIQLPVVEYNKVIGVLDLFMVLERKQEELDVSRVMLKDIFISQDRKNMYWFKESNQKIVPITDANGEYYGFDNKFYLKVMLPNAEYMGIDEIEEKLDIYDNKNLDIDKFEKRFRAVLESSFDGIYVTAGSETKKHLYGDLEKNELRKSKNIQGNKVNLKSRVELFKMYSEFEETLKITEKYHHEMEMLMMVDNCDPSYRTRSVEMNKIIVLARKIANVDSTVLLLGESGVGKSMMAKYIHDNSKRKYAPFVKIDCGSIPEKLFESELFGYEKGAFTGANNTKIGLMQTANKGTVFLDEIGELPIYMQMKILKVIQERKITRVGGTTEIPIDIRIISATNKNLKEMTEKNLFRKDLFYRLNVVPIKMPSLRQRKEDIQMIVDSVIKRLNEKFNMEKAISPEALKLLIDYNWPGNIRELENLIEYVVVTKKSKIIKGEDIPNNISYQAEIETDSNLNYNFTGKNLKDAMFEAERRIYTNLIDQCKNISDLARQLGIDKSTASRKIKVFGLNCKNTKE